jgi:hypothetical protein
VLLAQCMEMGMRFTQAFVKVLIQVHQHEKAHLRSRTTSFHSQQIMSSNVRMKQCRAVQEHFPSMTVCRQKYNSLLHSILNSPCRHSLFRNLCQSFSEMEKIPHSVNLVFTSHHTRQVIHRNVLMRYNRRGGPRQNTSFSRDVHHWN